MNDHRHCQELKTQLSDYIDGSLQDEMCRLLEQHLAECPDCQIVVNTLQKTIDLVHINAPPAQVPDPVRARLFRRFNLEDYLEGSHASTDK